MEGSSVYMCFRPLLIVCKFFGSCAIQNSLSLSAHSLKYSLKNPWLAHCIIFQVIISVMMHATLNLRRQSWPVTVFYDLRKWCFLAALLSTDSQRLSLLQGLENFDNDIYQLNKVKLLEYNPKRRGHLWHLLYHLIYTIGNHGLSYTMFYPKDKTPLGFFFDFMVKNFAAQMVFSYTVVNLAFNSELSFRYRLLSVSWSHHLRTLQQSPWATISALENLRLLHAKLILLVDQLTLCFGRFFVVNLFFVFLETLMYLHRTMLTNTNVFSNVQSVLFLGVNIASVPLLANSTYSLILSAVYSFEIRFVVEATKYKGKSLLHQLRNIQIVGLPRECKVQVYLSMKQLHRPSLKITGCGFFNIDRQLIVSMIVSMTTYFMVIIQMGPELGSLTARLFSLD